MTESRRTGFNIQAFRKYLGIEVAFLAMLALPVIFMSAVVIMVIDASIWRIDPVVAGFAIIAFMLGPVMIWAEFPLIKKAYQELMKNEDS